MGDAEKNEKELKLADEVAQSLQKAMKGIGTDEKRIINSIINSDNRLRQLIKTRYQILTGRDLIDDLSQELSGSFFEAIEALLTPTYEYEAKLMRAALLDDLTTDEKKCIQLLAPKDAFEMKHLRSAYKQKYGIDIEEDISSETHGDFSKTLIALASGKRNINCGFDIDEIKKQATKLYDAGQGKIGTDEDEYIRIFTTYSFSELYTLFALYAQITGDSVKKAIKKETSGDFRQVLYTIIKSVQNKPAYYAEQIYECMAGAGTDEKDLFELLVRRSDIDLRSIKEEYKKKYKWSLYDRVKDELSGDLKNLMLALIGPD